MDLFENKVHELYQQKKREDEKSIPGFDTFRIEPARIKKTYFLLKAAASVAVVVTAGSYYLYDFRRPTAKVYPFTITTNLPTQSLLDKNAGNSNIWTWKAPTDQLLNDAKKSLKSQL